jgi:hypothetical protein
VFEDGHIKHNASGLCLATDNKDAVQAGAIVVLDECSSSLILSADPPKSGVHQIVEKNSKMCLDCGNEPQFTPPCDPEQGKFRTAKFCDRSLDVKTRVVDMLNRTTLEDKLTQFAMWSSSMPSIDVNSYQYWNEGLHGVAGGPGVRFEEPTRNATVFPEPIGLATSWNRSLWRSIGAAVATEGRAMHNAGTAGLTYWAPNINIYRDPRFVLVSVYTLRDPPSGSSYSCSLCFFSAVCSRWGRGQVNRVHRQRTRYRCGIEGYVFALYRLLGPDGVCLVVRVPTDRRRQARTRL